MDLFDILWLVVCLGLPVISGIAASAEKKKKAQGRPVVTQEPEGNDLPSWMEILTGQPMEAESVDEVPEEQTVVEEVVPAAGKTLETKPTVAVLSLRKIIVPMLLRMAPSAGLNRRKALIKSVLTRRSSWFTLPS